MTRPTILPMGVELAEARAAAERFARTRDPDNFDVVNTATDKSHGIYDTLDEARGCVAFDRLARWEIWQGDHIVADSDPESPCNVDAERFAAADYEADWREARIEDEERSVREDAVLREGAAMRPAATIIAGTEYADEFVRAAFANALDGPTPDPRFATQQGAISAIESSAMQGYDRPLTTSDKLRLSIEVACAWNARGLPSASTWAGRVR